MKCLRSGALGDPTQFFPKKTTKPKKPNTNSPVLRKRILRLNGRLFGIQARCQVAISTQVQVAISTQDLADHAMKDPVAHAIPVLALFPCLANQKKNQQPAPRCVHSKRLAYYQATLSSKKAVQCLYYAAFLFNTEQGKEKSIAHRFLSSCLYMSFT